MHIPSNYYPVTSMIGIRDDKTAMTVLNDRSQGGSSIKDGRIELALNRKTVGADYGGMQIGVNIIGEVETEFYLHFDWKKSDQESLTCIKDLFAKLLWKSSSIANPLQFFKYTGDFEELDAGHHQYLNNQKVTRIELVNYIKKHGIVDLRLIPLESIYEPGTTVVRARIVLEHEENEKSEFKHRDLARRICKHALWQLDTETANETCE